MSAVASVKNNLAYATHQFFQNSGFNYIHTPLTTCADYEGAEKNVRNYDFHVTKWIN